MTARTKLEEDFIKIKFKFPFLGDVIIFNKSIYRKGYSIPVIKKHFSKLVEDEGWTKTERNQLIDWLITQTKK